METGSWTPLEVGPTPPALRLVLCCAVYVVLVFMVTLCGSRVTHSVGPGGARLCSCVDAWPPSPARPAVKPYLRAWKSYVAVLRGWACVSEVQRVWPAPRVGRTSPVAATLSVAIDGKSMGESTSEESRSSCCSTRVLGATAKHI